MMAYDAGIMAIIGIIYCHAPKDPFYAHFMAINAQSSFVDAIASSITLRPLKL